MIPDNAPKNLLTGQAGVYRVISELMLRGTNAYLPVVDVGVDLILGNGLKVQVKAARLRTQKYKTKGKVYIVGPAYFWSLNCSQKGNSHKYVKRPILYSEQVDYMVLWGIDEDRFWIVPASIVDDAGILTIYTKDSNTKYKSLIAKSTIAFEDRWDLITG